MSKDTYVRYRVEAFNLFNRVQFGYPGLVQGTSNFGVIFLRLSLLKAAHAVQGRSGVLPLQADTSHIFFFGNRVKTLISRINTVLDRHLRLHQPNQLRRAGNYKNLTILIKQRT
jgi:hypothetical protein